MPDRKPLSELLTLRREPIVIEQDREYHQITLRLYGRGATKRPAVIGSNIRSRRFRASTGQLIISKIDARNGALDIIPPVLDGCAVSADFLTYDVSDQLDLNYLNHVIRTPQFVRACDLASEGSTNRVRLKEDRFLQIEVPVPPIEEQKARAMQADRLLRVSSEIESFTGSFPTADALYQAAVDEVVRLGSHDPGGADQVLDGLEKRWGNAKRPSYNRATPGIRAPQEDSNLMLPKGWTWAYLGAICTEIVDCVNDTPDFEETATSFLGLKTSNVRPNRLEFDRKWYLNESTYITWNRRATPAAGDVVLTREAPMGMVALIPDHLHVALTQRLVLLRTDPNLVSPKFLCHMLNSRTVQSSMTQIGRSSPPHMRVQDIPLIKVPICGIQNQRWLSARLDRVYETSRQIESALTTQQSDVTLLSERIRQEAVE